jgi:sugar phosphate isomerase/epimerase
MKWSFQLYSARNFQPWDHVFETLAGLGYGQVEGYGDLYSDPGAVRASLDRHGLTMPSGHFMLDALEGDFERVRSVARTLGLGLVACPFIGEDERSSDEAGWRAFAARLAAIGERCRDAGLRFAWHNHDFEFRQTRDGVVPQRVILDAAPHIGWEVDVAWVVRGGADPLDWFDEYSSRIVAAHVKDIAPQGEAKDEDGWADVGHGTLDWGGLLAALRSRTSAELFVIEHDNPSDLARFAGRSIDAARRLSES